jgi:hypothetical protein
VSLARPGEMFPETRTRRLTAADVAGWDADKLRYGINEIYARGGYDFATPEIKESIDEIALVPRPRGDWQISRRSCQAPIAVRECES